MIYGNQPKKLLDQNCAELIRREKPMSIGSSATFYLTTNVNPKEMGESEIEAKRQHLTHLVVDPNMEVSTQNQVLCSLLFLSRDTIQADTVT